MKAHTVDIAYVQAHLKKVGHAMPTPAVTQLLKDLDVLGGGDERMEEVEHQGASRTTNSTKDTRMTMIPVPSAPTPTTTATATETTTKTTEQTNSTRRLACISSTALMERVQALEHQVTELERSFLTMMHRTSLLKKDKKHEKVLGSRESTKNARMTTKTKKSLRENETAGEKGGTRRRNKPAPAESIDNSTTAADNNKQYKRVDRVNRHRQMQQVWDEDPFLARHHQK